jgi:hypothetical protein
MGAQTGNVGLLSLDKDVRLPSSLPGVSVTDARDDSWSRLGNVGLPSLDKDARLPSGLPGVGVTDARDDSWSHLYFVGFYLAAKPSHVGGWCRWASLLSPPSYCMRLRHGAMLPDRHCPVLSRCSGRWHLFGECKAPGTWYLPRCWPSGSPIDQFWEIKWSVPWFDCDESLTWRGLNSNPG